MENGWIYIYIYNCMLVSSLFKCTWSILYLLLFIKFQISQRASETSAHRKQSLTASRNSSSAGRRGKGIGQGHVTRTRNIGYILILAGGGGLAPQWPLKGSPTLECVHNLDLQQGYRQYIHQIIYISVLVQSIRFERHNVSHKVNFYITSLQITKSCFQNRN